MVLDMENETATVFGKKIKLVMTSSGHYCIPLTEENPEESEEINEVLAVNLEEISEEEQFRCMKKLHSQFGHTVKERFKMFMKDAGAWQDGLEKHHDKIMNSCEGCIKKKESRKTSSVLTNGSVF